MEIIVALAMKFWQWSILIAVVIIGAIINFTDKRAKPKLKFSYTGMPHIKPLSTRNWELTQNWTYKLDGTEYVIPKGFTFDGASIPKFLRTFFSPVGVLLIGGLVHDYMYKYTHCKPVSAKGALLVVDQKKADQIFRDINIVVNGFYTMNYLAYWSLRIGGFVAWNGHRKRDNK